MEPYQSVDDEKMSDLTCSFCGKWDGRIMVVDGNSVCMECLVGNYISMQRNKEPPGLFMNRRKREFMKRMVGVEGIEGEKPDG